MSLPVGPGHVAASHVLAYPRSVASQPPWARPLIYCRKYQWYTYYTMCHIFENRPGIIRFWDGKALRSKTSCFDGEIRCKCQPRPGEHRGRNRSQAFQ